MHARRYFLLVLISVIKGEHLLPLATRRGFFWGIFANSPQIRRRECCSSSSPQISQVATPRDLCDLRESRRCCSGTIYATVVQYDYAALFFRPLFLVVDWW
ncbi:hypothetical protein H5410_047731 [Solanum commersonii]|uniref:Secreted protein n=1 Tax=Solanum commersonii TaxID=4109 RepID=A0A9J5XFZ6_SOLCO|nr:hypothetical protein H5410_047731 [Solanum commersonii]